MTTRLLLLRHGTTTAVRTSAFPVDEPLDDRGRAEAAALAPHLPGRAAARRSATRRAAETAAALGVPDAAVDPGLGEADFGAWAGRTLSEVHAEDPDAAVTWMTDPGFAPPGGESLEALCDRVAGWLDERATEDGTLVAVTHGGVVRAAIAAALGAPPSSAWRIDVAPGSITELHAHDGRWRLVRANWTPSRHELRAARAAAGLADEDHHEAPAGTAGPDSPPSVAGASGGPGTADGAADAAGRPGSSPAVAEASGGPGRAADAMDAAGRPDSPPSATDASGGPGPAAPSADGTP